MAREGIEIRRLAIANELIALAIPRARTDRNFPAWVTRTLSGDRRFGSRDRRFYRELVFTAVRFMPWVEGVAEADRARASLWLSADTNETRDARGILGDTAVRAVAPLTARAAAFNDAFPGAGAQMDSLLPEWTAGECPALFSPGETSVVHTRAPLWIRIQTPDPVRIAQELETAGIAIDLDDRIPGASSADPMLQERRSTSTGSSRCRTSVHNGSCTPQSPHKVNSGWTPVPGPAGKPCSSPRWSVPKLRSLPMISGLRRWPNFESAQSAPG